MRIVIHHHDRHEGVSCVCASSFAWYCAFAIPSSFTLAYRYAAVAAASSKILELLCFSQVSSFLRKSLPRVLNNSSLSLITHSNVYRRWITTKTQLSLNLNLFFIFSLCSINFSSKLNYNHIKPFKCGPFPLLFLYKPYNCGPAPLQIRCWMEW